MTWIQVWLDLLIITESDFWYDTSNFNSIYKWFSIRLGELGICDFNFDGSVFVSPPFEAHACTSVGGIKENELNRTT